jgi:hypothetical protein
MKSLELVQERNRLNNIIEQANSGRIKQRYTNKYQQKLNRGRTETWRYKQARTKRRGHTI